MCKLLRWKKCNNCFLNLYLRNFSRKQHIFFCSSLQNIGKFPLFLLILSINLNNSTFECFENFFIFFQKWFPIHLLSLSCKTTHYIISYFVWVIILFYGQTNFSLRVLIVKKFFVLILMNKQYIPKFLSSNPLQKILLHRRLTKALFSFAQITTNEWYLRL